jgi:hypothetical protein
MTPTISIQTLREGCSTVGSFLERIGMLAITDDDESQILHVEHRTLIVIRSITFDLLYCVVLFNFASSTFWCFSCVEETTSFPHCGTVEKIAVQGRQTC